MHRRIDRKMGDGLWKVFFINQKGKLRTWFVFVEDSRDKSISRLNQLPRLGKGKSLKHVFNILGIKYVPKTKSLPKKLKNFE